MSRKQSLSERKQSLSELSLFPEDQTEESKIAQNICFSLLNSGHVRSFGEFFNLAIKDKQSPDLKTKDLILLKDLFTRAEQSHRTGDLKAIYAAKSSIAKFFEQIGDYQTALKYFCDGLEVSKLNGGTESSNLMEALLDYGNALEHSGEFYEALNYVEQAINIAQSSSNHDMELKASKNAVAIRIKIAQQLELNENYDEGILHYLECIKIVRNPAFNFETTEKSLIYEITFQLGKAYKEINKLEPAIKYLNSFLEICKKSDNHSKEGWARVLLAACYEKSGDGNLAVTYLQQFITIAEHDQNQKKSLSQAHFLLGHLFTTVFEDFYQSECHYEQHYKLAVQLQNQNLIDDDRDVNGDESMQNEKIHHEISKLSTSGGGLKDRNADNSVGVAKILLGISRGNSKMKEFFYMVSNPIEINNLLDFKSGNMKIAYSTM